jgi:hypothetical protein
MSPFHQIIVAGRFSDWYEGYDAVRAKEVFNREVEKSKRENKGRLVTWYTDCKQVKEFIPTQPAAPIHNERFPTA